MILLPPNSQPPLKLNRVIKTALTQINGFWTITNGVFFSKISDLDVIINGSAIALCQGQNVFSYVISNEVAINLTKIKSNFCNKLLVDAFPNASLYRLNNVINPKILTIYDKNANLIMQLTYEQNYPVVKPIDFSTLINNLNKTGATVNNTTTVIKNNNTIATINANTVKIINNTASVLKNNTGSVFNNTDTIIKNSTSTIIKNISNSQINVQNNNNQTNTSNQLNLAIFLPLQTSNQAYGIWYTYNTSSIPILSKYNISDLAKYQIIINSARILISGGCNTVFSSYSFSAGTFMNFTKV
jgi:hypothetical protein